MAIRSACSAATLAAGLPLTPLAATAPLLPASFVKSGGSYELRRGTAKLWAIDGRLFDFSGNGRIGVEASGQRLVVESYLAGSNIGVKLAISISQDLLAFSSFGGAKQTVAITDWTGGARGVGIEFKTDPYKSATIKVGGLGTHSMRH